MSIQSTNNDNTTLPLEKRENTVAVNNTNDNSQQNDANQEDQEMVAKQEVHEYLTEWKKLYNNLMIFIENSDDDKIDFQNLIELIHQQKISESREKFEDFLKLVANIANNHNRGNNLFRKILQIIQYYEIQIKQTFSNFEIYNIFQNNKKFLLFLFDNETINFDEDICKQILSKTDPNKNRYYHFFYPEIKKFDGRLEKIENIEKELLTIDSHIFDRFEEKRREGENDSDICTLIRKDAIHEFIMYVHKRNIPLNSQVEPSIFETNSFLLERNPTLIEYSAFFGASKIFSYLKTANASTNSLYIYAIHSKSARLIHLCEYFDINSPNYDQCYSEAVKCHHNNIADYFENNFLKHKADGSLEMSYNVVLSIFKYQNYQNFPSDFASVFYYLCCYQYKTLVKLLLKQNEKKINDMIQKYILNYIFF